MASFAPQQSTSRPIPPPGSKPPIGPLQPGMGKPPVGGLRPISRPGKPPIGGLERNPYRNQSGLTPELLAQLARRRLGG